MQIWAWCETETSAAYKYRQLNVNTYSAALWPARYVPQSCFSLKCQPNIISFLRLWPTSTQTALRDTYGLLLNCWAISLAVIPGGSCWAPLFSPQV